MLKTIKALALYGKNMGPDWVLFRLKYELKKKTGYFNHVNQKILSKVNRLPSSALIFSKLNLVNPQYRVVAKNEQEIIDKAEKALKGEFFVFSHTYLNYADQNGEINWHLNPVSQVAAPAHLPWNHLPDFGPYGDIKIIWEASRFPQIFHLINAYSLTKDSKFALGALKQIEQWIDHNPFPYGVNYKCGQEITFRLFAWILALDYFYDFLTPVLASKILKNIYVSLLRIESNIDFAARSVKNNHSISEASGLLIGGLLFSQFPEAKSWVKRGVSYLIQELDYQVYEDGSYIQHSFNYQRLVLDVLSFVILVSRKIGFKLPEQVVTAHGKVFQFLSAFVQPNGFLPNYGHNDGSNLFPLGNLHYRDFSESLNLAGALQNPSLTPFPVKNALVRFFDLPTGKSNLPIVSNRFDDGGYYILRNDSFFTFLRCHSFKHRPAHSDMLHLDVWHKDINIFCDSGTFSYRAEPELKKQFFGTLGHNTIVINDSDQMQDILHFGWANWLKSKLIHFDENAFIGEHYGYLKRFKAIHRRSVRIEKNKIHVTDIISGQAKKVDIKQVWNTSLSFKQVDPQTFVNDLIILHSNISASKTEALISDFYNDYSTGERIIFNIQTSLPFTIETTIELQ